MKENWQPKVEVLTVDDVKKSFDKGRENGEEVVNKLKVFFDSFKKAEKNDKNKKVKKYLMTFTPFVSLAPAIIIGGLVLNTDNTKQQEKPLVLVENGIYQQGDKLVTANQESLKTVKVVGYRYNITDNFYNEVVGFEKNQEGKVVVKIERYSKEKNEVADTFYFSEAGIDTIVSTEQGFHGKVVEVDGQAFWVSEFGEEDIKTR